MTKADQPVIGGVDGILSSKEVAVVEATAQGVVIGGIAYTIARRVNVPVLTQEDGEVVAFKVLQPIREEVNYKETDVVVNGERVKGVQEVTINIIRVEEIGSKQEMDYVANAMTAGNLRATYPDHAYVGKTFAIQKLGVVPGKQYKATNVVEIQPA